MSLHPYLFFNGTCEEAFKFYAEILGGTIEAMVTYAEAPSDDNPLPEHPGKIMHAYLKFEDSALMASDAPPDRFERMAGFYVQVAFAEPSQAERVFSALAAGGKVQLPLEETFWARRFGMVTDRFGVPWMVNVNKPD